MQNKSRHIIPCVLLLLAIILATASAWHYVADKQKLPNDFPDTKMYPTELFPSKVIFVDNRNIIVLQDNSLFLLNTETRHSKRIFRTNDEIVDFAARDTEHIIIAQRKGTTLTILLNSLAAKDTSLFTITIAEDASIMMGRNLLCITRIKEILSPTEIATSLLKYQIAKSHQVETYSTTLTLIPVSCEDQMILVQPYPLQTKLFRWDSPNSNPEELDATFGDLLSFSIESEVLGVRTSETFFLYNNKTPASPNKIQAANIHQLWCLVDDTTIAAINKSATTIAIYSSEETQRYNISDTGATFTTITSNSEGTLFGLIASDGRLWILQI